MLRHLTVFVMAFASVASAQTQTTAPRGNSTTQTLIDLEKKWADANVKADTSVLAGIFADTYVFTDTQGHQTDKSATLAPVKSGELKFKSHKISDVRVHLYGSTAVVTGVSALSGTSKGQPLPAKVAFTDTFIQQNGAWRAVATHLSEVR